jgi:sigma-B regulation protein RsbU (phosphoserine phosphatase)
MSIPTRSQLISCRAIINALNKGHSDEAETLLRNHLETAGQLLEYSGAEPGLLQRELDIAREVQSASFPKQPPSIPGLSSAIFYKPACSIGGDYYDFLPLQNDAWGFAIGDVSGKGLGAALALANLQGSVRAQTLHSSSSPEALVSNVNRLFWRSSPQHFFASLFYAEYQPQSRVLRYVNAGHNAPIVLRQKGGRYTLLPLKADCVPVGLIEDTLYTSTTFQLQAEDFLIAYTDGLTEAENNEGDAFGQNQLENILGRCRTDDPQKVLQLILNELSTHSAGYQQADDITLVVIQVAV